MPTYTNNVDHLPSLPDGSPYRHTFAYSRNPGPMDEEEDEKTMAIMFAVFVGVIVLLWVLCFCVRKGRGALDAGGANRPPSSAVAGNVEVVPVRPAEPPLVCAYSKADGWADESSCGVCLAELDDGEVVRVLPACMHYFHAACVGEWLHVHATCPLCRAPLVAPN